MKLKHLFAALAVTAATGSTAFALLETEETPPPDSGALASGWGEGAWGESAGNWDGSTDAGGGQAVDPPQPLCPDYEWDEGSQSYRVEVVGSRAAADDGTGPTVTESQTVEVVGRAGEPIGIFPVTADHPYPSVDPTAIGFRGTNTTTTGRPDEALVVAVPTPQGRPVNAAVSPFVPLVLTMNAVQNHNIILAKLAEIGRIRNLAFRYALVTNLINQMLSYELKGFPISSATWSWAKGNWRMLESLIRLGPQMGAVSLGMLARFNAVLAAGAAGYWLGGQIYNKWAWLGGGGLDPVICAVRYYAFGVLDPNCDL